MKILVCCSTGLSSNLLVDKMRKYINENDLDDRVASVGINQLKKYVSQCDIVLLAPQMTYCKEYVDKLCHLYDVPVLNIGRKEFGILDVKHILEYATTSYYQSKTEELRMNLKIEQTIEKLVVPIANKMSTNKILSAISGGFMRVLPITIAGSMITLIANFPIEAWTNFLTKSGILNLLNICSNATLGIISLFTTIFIAYSYAKQYDADGVSVSLVSLVSFVVLTPMVTSITAPNKEIIEVANVLPLQWLGSAGLFSSIIISLVSTRIYIFIVQKNIKITMPESVPSNIAKPFEALIPAVIVFAFMLVIHYIFSLTEFGNIHNCIYSVIQMPLQGFTSSFWIVCIVSPIIFAILWFFGLHAGQIIIFPILMPLLMPASLENLAAYQAGTALPNILTYETLSIGQSLGGVGNTIGLCICMLLFAKSKRYRALSKMSIAPSLFCINEPIIFGTPIVMNLVLIAPFIIAPIVTAVITYLCMSIGLVPFASGVQLPWTTPIVLFGFLECGFAGAILQIVLIIISVGIYYPFFKVIDKKALKDEIENEEIQISTI
ncbi:PTS transporter subunit EIIC [Allocoprobacillus halotolerans]|uniref:PTS system lactose-specific EIICB component n=1 Tax=Allocoprobacillus halotolerans TaxID=2944914 RepID=A0ABY5I7E8_9FIRM|nr:PTS transporter subunit EIIC [Allocoprobacillus halotolerans]UTY39943.1 PTS transporter subunit EIIC [Allocoprobacillus halotolerans]